MDQQAEYDEYKAKQNYYGNIRAQLSTASAKIKRIKPVCENEELRVFRLTRGLSWKGKTRDAFEQTLTALEVALSKHSEKIDNIHDQINIEWNEARRQEHDYGLLIEGLAYIVVKTENAIN